MDTQRQQQIKTSAPSSPASTGLFQPRPFTPPEAEASVAPNLQTQLETASRFGHNFSRVQVQNQPSEVTQQPVNERKDEPDSDWVTPMKMMAPPLGSPIQRQAFEEEPIQMMPQWGLMQRSEAEEDEKPQMPQIQLKVVVGQPGDKYEQEADLMAAQVMSMNLPTANSAIQRQREEEQEDLVQRSFLANSITPLVQRQTEEQEEAIQTKLLLQRAGNGKSEANSNVESQLNSSKGGGSPLPDEVRSFMEPRFGNDFSNVRVHTDASAIQMNKDLSAQAFTHGSDIYYGSGKSAAKDDLTAHELTHVVQQTGAQRLQQKPITNLKSNKETLQKKPITNLKSNKEIQTKISPAFSFNSPKIQLKQAPDSPQTDPSFQAVVNKTKGVASQQKAHPPAKTKSTEAQAAAKPPTNEVESKAQDKQVQVMNQQQPGQFNAAAFKAALMQKITTVTPNTLEEADKFKDSNKLDSVKGDVSSKVTEQKKQASTPIEETTKQPPNTSGITPKPVTPLPPKQAGAKPGDVGAAGAAPKPKDASEVSLQAGSESLDQQMVSANVTDEQLKKSNEPEFQGALDAKKTAQTDCNKAPQDYRQKEQGIVNRAQNQAKVTAASELQGMHGGKEKILAKVLGNQSEAKGQDEQKRADVANHIQGIYKNTKQKVETALSQLDGEVNSQFDSGAAAAQKLFEDFVGQRMQRYKDERYDGASGKLKWVKDKLLGMPSEVNAFYQEGKKQYLTNMDKTIDKIANLVSTKLNAAKQEIAKGRQEIQKYVAGLEPSLRQVGQEAAQNIQGKFDELETSVDNKQNELIDSLAQKYNENLKNLDSRIDEMKAENRGLVDKAKDAIAGTIKTILEMKNLLMGVLAKAAGAIDKIIKDPIAFLGNLISGIKQGFQNFAGNIWTHLKKGMLAFLTGALAGAGITMPESFDLKGIFSLVMQVLGVVYDAIKSRVIKALGKNGAKIFNALEKSFEMFVILKNEGIAGLWQFIQDKIGDLKAMVIDTIQSFVVESVIKAGVLWVLSLLNPASAFVRACKAIYDIIMFFIERGSQIAELVSAVTESVAAIANGAVGGAAKLIENALGTALPVVISFMASLLGLGGISEKIEGVIKTVRAPIDKAIDWLIAQAVKFAKKMGKAIGFGKEGKGNKDDKPSAEDGKTGAISVPFSMSGEGHTLSFVQQGNQAQILMASSSGLLTTKLSTAQSLVEGKKQEYPEDTYAHLTKSLAGLTKAVTKVSGQLSGSSLTEKEKNKYTETLKRVAVNIANFGNKWGLKDITDAPSIVGTDPKNDLSALERKMLSKLKGGSKHLADLDDPKIPELKKQSLREEARVALDAVRRGEKDVEVGQIMDREGNKAGKQNKGELDVVTKDEIIEVKGSAKYATIDQPDAELKGQVEKYIQKVKKEAKADPSVPTRKIVVHLTGGASEGVRNWFAAKANKSGVTIEVRIGQR